MTQPSNYYADNVLNRLSYLRTSQAFLTSAIASDKTKFLLYDSLNPLAAPPAADGSIKLHTVGWNDVKEFIGDAEEVFQGVDGKDEKYTGEISGFWTNKEKDKTTLTPEEKRQHFINQPPLVFLGVEEPPNARSLPTEKPSDTSTLESHSPDGVPYFALDVSTLTKLKERFTGGNEKYEFVDMRAGMSTIPAREAALAAEGRSLIDWNKRNLFCAACSRPLKSCWAGWKRSCITEGPTTPDAPAIPPCATKKGPPSNLSYPRTDPVIIAAILDPTKESILLGRQRVWPKKFYSCLAGFIEPGESLEEAVRREIYEEAGIDVDEVYYHSTQPWPYPSSLMIGCIGIAKPNQTIRTDLDNELEDARWFSRANVLAVVDGAKQHSLTREEVHRIEGKEGTEGIKDKKEDGDDSDWFRMPPSTAIANTLITAWAKNTYQQASNSTQGKL